MSRFKLVKKEFKIFLVAFLVSGGIFAALMSVSKIRSEGEFSLGEFLLTFLFWGNLSGFFVRLDI